jgi:hypothetical protein
LSDDELVAAGISAGTIRLSVGLEDLDDLVWDLDRSLAAAQVLGPRSQVSGNGHDPTPDTRHPTPSGVVA